MPEQWSPDMYRLLAEQWQAKADALPAGQERDMYLLIADGYAGLARIGPGHPGAADNTPDADSAQYLATC